MRRATSYLFSTLFICLLLLLPAILAAEPTEEMPTDRRSRMLRRGAPAEPATAARPTPAQATAPNPLDASDDPTYGYTKDNPVKLGSPEFSEAAAASYYYLRMLRDRTNKPFIWHRIGNVGPGADGHIVDLYKLTDSAGNESRVYIDMYHPDVHPKELKAPQGMGLAK